MGAAGGAGRPSGRDRLAALRARVATAFASLSRTSDDLNALAANREELPPNPGARTAPLAHLERALFGEQADAPELDGSIRFLEGAGLRGTLELVAEEVLALLRSGTEAGEIAIVCPSLERWRAPLDTAFTTLGVPYALEGRLRLGQTPFGQALLALLRYAWLDGERRDLFAFLRSPYSGLARHHVDFLEGRLRGRGVTVAARVEEEVAKLRGQPLPHLEAVRSAADPLAAVKELARAMARAAYGLESPPTGGPARLDLRAHEKVARLVAELEGWRDLGGEVTREEAFALLDNAPVRLASAGEAGRVAVLDLLRARTRRFEVVFILGLEEGHLPRRAQGSPFLDEDQKAELERSSRSGRLLRTDPVSRDRYLFYTACTRPTRRLYLVREAASDEGSPRESSPFWDEVHDLFAADEIERWTKRRPLAALTWQLEAAPSERERLRALASLASSDRLPASALARANGWERRLERALGAFDRPTRLTHPAVLEELRQKASFSVTDLERFADCSSMWLFERVVSPRSIDAEVDARLRGTVAHQALFSFFKGLPKRTGAERVQPENLDDALVFLRECLADAMKAHVRVDVPELERRELEQSLARDLDELVRREAESESPLVPDRFEVSFGSERSAPELQRGPRPGRLHGLGQDRPDRPRSVRRARDRRRLQVGPHRALGCGDRARPPAADPALHARPARPRRDRAARRRLPGSRRRRQGARAPTRRAARGRRARLPEERLPRRGRVLGPGRGGAGAGAYRRREDPRGRRQARPEGRVPVPDVVQPLDDVPGEAVLNGDIARDVAFRPSRLCWLGRRRRWPGAPGSGCGR